jgi:glucose/arabinose dehydrogenase
MLELAGSFTRGWLRLTGAALIGISAHGCSGSNSAKNPASIATPVGPTAASTTAATLSRAAQTTGSELLTGEAARGDWQTDRPGVRRKLTTADLPAAYATQSAKNHPHEIAQPPGATLHVPEGFHVAKFAIDLDGPRMLRTAPNGDIFVAESKSNRIRVLRDANGDGQAELSEVFAADLKQPFGIAFYPPGANPTHVYVANTDSVVRFAYTAGDIKAKQAPQVIVKNLPSGGMLEGGGHWTRDVVFSNDGTKMYVSVGSLHNVSEAAAEARRARIFEYSPEGKNERVYASGIRNPVGLAVHPTTAELWTSVNERDELGDHLVPDYVTHVSDGAFYGWPWFYLGGNADPRLPNKRLDLQSKVTLPDVLLQSHSASLGMTFYTGEQFPTEYRGQAFAALHGSWNRSQRTGYKVVYMPLEHGKATGEYVDFLTGFVADSGDVWGRPVAVTVARDGALLVSDDAGDVVWRVAYTASK